jgi:hypothetical protein
LEEKPANATQWSSGADGGERPGPRPLPDQAENGPERNRTRIRRLVGRHYGGSETGCDQGSAFTSEDWTEVLKQHGIRISMDGKGQWMDNVFIERLWRSMKYECVYLNAFRNFRDAEDHSEKWIGYYNNRRPHSSLGDLTPAEVHDRIGPVPSAA